MLLAIGMSGFLVNPAGSNRLWANLLTKTSSGTPYCRPIEIAVPRTSIRPPIVEPSLAIVMKSFAGPSVGVEADVDVAFMTLDVELVGQAAGMRQSLASRLMLPDRRSATGGRRRRIDRRGDRDPASAAGADRGRAAFASSACPAPSLRLGAHRLAPLGTVAVDRQGLEAEPPAFEVGPADLFDRRLVRHVARLRDRPRRNGCTAAIIRRWPEEMDAPPALRRGKCAVEDRQVLVPQAGCPFDRVVRVDVVEDRRGSPAHRSPVSAGPSGTVRLTIFSIPPPASCLYLTSAMSGSIPVVSQSIMKAMVPVGARTVTWLLR